MAGRRCLPFPLAELLRPALAPQTQNQAALRREKAIEDLRLRSFRRAKISYTGFSPRMVTRRNKRRSTAEKSVRACSVQRLSHITMSPTRQTCS
jgi:hypothetical protein